MHQHVRTIDYRSEDKLKVGELKDDTGAIRLNFLLSLDFLFWKTPIISPRKINRSARRCIWGYCFSAVVSKCQILNQVAESQLFTSLWNRFHQGFSTSSSFRWVLFSASYSKITPLFHCWKANLGLKSSRKFRTPEIEYFHILSLWPRRSPGREESGRSWEESPRSDSDNESKCLDRNSTASTNGTSGVTMSVDEWDESASSDGASEQTSIVKDSGPLSRDPDERKIGISEEHSTGCEHLEDVFRKPLTFDTVKKKKTASNHFIQVKLNKPHTTTRNVCQIRSELGHGDTWNGQMALPLGKHVVETTSYPLPSAIKTTFSKRYAKPPRAPTLICFPCCAILVWS